MAANRVRALTNQPWIHKMVHICNLALQLNMSRNRWSKQNTDLTPVTQLSLFTPMWNLKYNFQTVIMEFCWMNIFMNFTNPKLVLKATFLNKFNAKLCDVSVPENNVIREQIAFIKISNYI